MTIMTPLSTPPIILLFLYFLSLPRCDCKPKDWLITNLDDFPSVTLTKCNYNDFPCIELSNSLLSRKFIISPNFFTVEYNSLLSSHCEYALRSPFSPEALIGLNDVNYSIGGISYLNRSGTTAAFWDPSFLKKENIAIDSNTTFLFDSYSTSTSLYKLYDWIPGTRGSFEYIPWPPKGLQLNVTFKPPISSPEIIQKYLTVTVQYEMYQGMPLISKRVFIQSTAPSMTSNVMITYVQAEELKTNIPFGVGEKQWDWGSVKTPMVPFPGMLWIELDVPKGVRVEWSEDPDKTTYKSNNYGGYEPMVRTYYTPTGDQSTWSVRLSPNLPGTEDGIFASFRTFELFFDSFDLERQGLARRRLMSFMSPTITESPVYTQTINMSNASLYEMVDQCIDTGFEILAFSFDSGFNMETSNQSELEYYKKVISYANRKGLEIGGYDLVDMARNITKYERVSVDGELKKGLCFASHWVDELTAYFDQFIDGCGGTMFITDGPYPGWSCNSASHQYHDDLSDSVFRETYLQNEWYLYYRNKGVYIHSPDDYYYFGINKNKYPYNERTTTLPRWWDLTVYRQLMYDNSYRIPVTAGWMFLPMSPYHGGGEDAIFEPVSKHVDDYSFALGQYFSFAVAATIRGNELYDDEVSRQIVKQWVAYYKKYRKILMSDIIHIARPTNLGIDAIMHVNHMLEECAMLIVFNPLNETLKEVSLDISLYYAGARDTIRMRHEEETRVETLKLEDTFDYTLTFDMPARNLSYWTFKCQ